MVVEEPVNLIKVPLSRGKRCWSLCVHVRPGDLCELTGSRRNRKEGGKEARKVLLQLHNVAAGKPLILSGPPCCSTYSG